MKKEYSYMDDEELEALIAKVENGGMIAPPAYLKELIMKAAGEEKEAFCEEKETSGEKKEMGLSVPGGGRSIAVRKETARAAKVQFWIYSLKIVAAAAAAVFCLITMPADLSGGGMAESGRMAGDSIEKRIEEDTERYWQEKKRALASEERTDGRKGGLLGGLSGGSLEGINGIFNGFSNWFGMEEKIYE